jgi:hypothetical protein
MGSESFDIDLSGIMDAHGIFADASRRTENPLHLTISLALEWRSYFAPSTMASPSSIQPLLVRERTIRARFFLLAFELLSQCSCGGTSTGKNSG